MRHWGLSALFEIISFLNLTVATGVPVLGFPILFALLKYLVMIRKRDNTAGRMGAGGLEGDRSRASLASGMEHSRNTGKAPAKWKPGFAGLVDTQP